MSNATLNTVESISTAHTNTVLNPTISSPSTPSNMRLIVLASSIAFSAAAGIAPSALKSYVVSNHERFLSDLSSQTQTQLQTQTKPVMRRLAGVDEDTYFCDIQFMECLGHPKCTSCFKDMQEQDIDWSIIPPNSACDDVLDALINKVGKCQDLRADSPEKQTFCKTFDSCVIWKDDANSGSDAGGNGNGEDDNDKHIDCNSLTKCEFDGMKPSYIGDGVCHEFIDGCYNTEICGYDGGDCCPDTCKNTTDLVGCGSDQYFCRDPKSANCETCDKKDGGADSPDGPVKPLVPNCTDDETPYKLFQFDSFGDGWDRTDMMITEREDITHTPLYDGRLEDGSEGMEYICLSKSRACYQVKLFGGFWGNEVSWQIKPMKNGAPEIASGGAPMECEFPVGGALHCDNSCTGRANVDPKEDDKYHTYHQMANCIEDKCIIQLAMCEEDYLCSSCIGDSTTPSYCMASDIFNALAFCTECNCVEDIDQAEKEKFCKDKSREKHENEDATDDSGNDSSSSNRVKSCSYDEFTKGSAAVIQYSECSGIETFSALLTNFDPDNFGMLDSFESCASDYTKSRYGKSALDCMRILEDAIVNPTKGIDPSKADTVPSEAISALAKDLLQDGEKFCECSSDASGGLYPCKDFIHFKTLLYESIDACKGLDAIDCDAWAEFYKPCKSNMLDKFKKIDFRKKQQCGYIHDGCGNVGPFPSFRRLDCGKEISEEAWDMYLDYERNCLRGGPTPQSPVPVPAPKPPTGPAPGGGTTTPMPSAGKKKYPTPSNGVPNSSEKKKYVPPEKRNGSKGRKFFRFILFCSLVAAAYWFYKKRYGDFDLNQFRRTRNYGADNAAMYDSLTMENAQASFQPPTLPPPPSAYDTGGNNNGMYNMNSGGFA